MLKLGEKIISDIYLGDKKIAKVFLGDKLVYQAGKPIFLDYVIFDGNSWIDTGLYGSNNTKIEATYQPTAFENGFYGSYSSGKNFTAYISKSGAWRFGNGAVYHTHTSSIVCDSIQNKDGATVNGKTLAYSAQSDFVTASTLTVGKVNGSTFTNFKGNIYSFIVYESDVLIQDLRPCIDLKGTVCFYDMVTKKYFYNKGTGTLTAGNKINFVDYIIFDGDSWIDVGYAPTNNTRIVGKFSITKFKGYGANYVFGVFGDNANYGLNIGSNREMLNVPWASASAVAMNNPNNLGQVYAFDISKNGAYIDGEQKITASQLTATFTATKTFFIGWSNGTSTDKLIGNIYPVQIYENDVLVRDLRPCVIASAIGLYDMVTGKFYTNIGTGTLKASGRFVKSILFDGASYIDTGIAHQTCDIECDIRFEETGTRQLMGFGTGSGQYWGAGATGIFDYMAGTNALDRTLVVIDFNAEEFKYTIYADGKSRTSASGNSLSRFTYRIGAGPTGVSSNSYWCTCEVWSNKTYINGELIQDLRPYVDENGVACFKDIVTGNLFYNQGTGTLGYTEE